MSDIFDSISDPNIYDGESTKNFLGAKKTSGRDIFDEFPDESEPSWKSAVRTIMQPVLGVLEGTTYGIGAGLFQLGALGESELDVEQFHKLRELAEQKGETFDEEAYENARQEMLQSIPTVENIARKVEEKTGLPLEAKTRVQKGLRLGSMVSKMQPGSIGNKLTAGATTSAVSQGLQELGIPEQVSDLAAIGVGTYAGIKGPNISVGTKKKPSGLTERRFERLEKPTEVSSKKIGKINEKVESEFRDISDKIIKESPISETFENLKNDTEFKTNSSEAFKEVEKLSEELPERFSTSDLKKKLVDEVLKKKGTGFTPSEFDKIHKKLIAQFIKDTPTQEISAKDLVTQYRKNNEALKEAYEPGQSYAYNRGKRQALQDYNIAIASEIQNKFPDTEFSNLFFESNKRWSEIMDAEAIDKYLDGIFEGKINHKEAQKLLDKPGMNVPFKRALGEEGYKNFERLVKDLLSSETPYKMMKVGQKKGFFSDLGSTALAYILHPKIAAGKLAYDVSKRTWDILKTALLDKPELAVKWEKGLKNLKKGNFAQAEKDFSELKEVSEKHVELLPAEKTQTKVSEQKSIEVKAEKIEPKKPEKTTFKTEKGSTYEVDENGSTTRNKAYRKEHGEKEQGIQKPSDNTYYVKPEDVDKLSVFQTRGDSPKKISSYGDKVLLVEYVEGPNKGKGIQGSVVEYSKEPSEGLIPVESWDNGEKIHFGNKIVEVIKKVEKLKPPELPATPKKSIESPKKEVKRQDISKKGLKSQKDFILKKLEDVLENPDKYEGQKKILLDVPGDGEFKIQNDRKALNQFYKNVKKDWPDRSLRKNWKPGQKF